MGFLGIIAILVLLYDTCDPFINKKSNRNDKFIVLDEADSDFNHQLGLFGKQLPGILEKGGFDIWACATLVAMGQLESDYVAVAIPGQSHYVEVTRDLKGQSFTEIRY